MDTMVLDAPGRPLRRVTDVRDPSPRPGEVLVAVHACAVCRTDLHIVDGDLAAPRLPLVPGHQIVGTVLEAGDEAEAVPGARVGIPWLGWTCGVCRFCRSGRENLCVRPRFTGLDIDGGYATHAVADARFCFALPEAYGDLDVAPLLCAGLIGHRALRMTGDAERLGLYGFGAAAHIVCQVARHQGRRVFAFTRAGDEASQRFARSLGCEWAGDALGPAPEELDAAIVFAPAGELVVAALRALGPGGAVVCAGIHMSDIPSFAYADLWRERSIRSVANLTRDDARELLALAPRVPVRTHVTTYPLAEAGAALDDLRAGRLEGAAVLVPDAARPGGYGEAMTLAVGDPAPGFSLPDTDGTPHALEPGAPTVVVFTCNHCPYALAWHDRLLAVARDYADRGVRMVAINPNDAARYPRDSYEAMQERVRADGGWPIPYLRDESQEVARAYGARTTPDIFVVGPDGRVAYRGAPDADHGDPSLDAAWLREALDDVLAGAEVRRAQTDPVGCSVKWR